MLHSEKLLKTEKYVENNNEQRHRNHTTALVTCSSLKYFMVHIVLYICTYSSHQTTYTNKRCERIDKTLSGTWLKCNIFFTFRIKHLHCWRFIINLYTIREDHLEYCNILRFFSSLVDCANSFSHYVSVWNYLKISFRKIWWYKFTF